MAVESDGERVPLAIILVLVKAACRHDNVTTR